MAADGFSFGRRILRFGGDRVLTKEQLKRLAEHKYSSEGSSLVEALMQPFWRKVVEWIPIWWAPNAITLAGLIVNAVTVFILMLFSPDAKGEVNDSASSLQYIKIG